MKHGTSSCNIILTDHKFHINPSGHIKMQILKVAGDHRVGIFAKERLWPPLPRSLLAGPLPPPSP